MRGPPAGAETNRDDAVAKRGQAVLSYIVPPGNRAALADSVSIDVADEVNNQSSAGIVSALPHVRFIRNRTSDGSCRRD
jgi:hypothetical protein